MEFDSRGPYLQRRKNKHKHSTEKGHRADTAGSTKMTAAQVELAVIQQFYNLYKLYRETDIIEANIKSIEIRIRQLELRVANGQNLISDLKRTELQLSNYQIDVFRTRNNIAIIANYLCILTGIDPPILLTPADAQPEVPGDTLVYEDCLAEAMNNRYELKQSELNKELSELDMKMTRSARLPVLTGNALYNSDYPVPGTFLLKLICLVTGL